MIFRNIGHKALPGGYSAKNPALGEVLIRPSGEGAYTITVAGRPVSMNVPARFVNYLAERFDLPRLLASDAVAGDVYGSLQRAYYESLSRDAVYLERGDWGPYILRPHQEDLLNFAMKAESVTLKDAERITGLSRRGAQETISDLVSKRLLSMAGSGRSSHYVLRGMDVFGYRDYELVLPSSQASLMFATRRSSKATFEAMSPKVLACSCAYPNQLSERFDRLAALSRARGASLDDASRKRRYEKLVVEFAYSSSKYEGNTYSLLETERLLFHGQAAPKRHEDATMLLNHKRAVEFVMSNRAKFRKLTPALVEAVHSIVSDGLGVPRGMRNDQDNPVSISGTTYKPTDDPKKLAKFVAAVCDKINAAKSPVDKAVVANTHIAFAQAFWDCNKRTARTIGNALLIAHGMPPIAFRVVEKDQYNASILTFYETADPRFFMLNMLKELQNSVNSYLGMS